MADMMQLGVAIKVEGGSKAVSEMNSFKTATVSAETATKSFGNTLNKDFAARLDKLSGSFRSVGTSMSLAFTAPIALATGVAIKSASDLEESMNKVKVVFGDAALSITNFAETSAKDLGMSQQAALEAAGTFFIIACFGTYGATRQALKDSLLSVLC